MSMSIRMSAKRQMEGGSAGTPEDFGPGSSFSSCFLLRAIPEKV